jgi:hypothetical protein
LAHPITVTPLSQVSSLLAHPITVTPLSQVSSLLSRESTLNSQGAGFCA